MIFHYNLRIHQQLWLLLLVGCAALPDHQLDAPAGDTPATWGLIPPNRSLRARVGIEYLPPPETQMLHKGPAWYSGPRELPPHEDPFGIALGAMIAPRQLEADAVNIKADKGPGWIARKPEAARREVMRALLPWERSEKELGSVRDPLERFTLNFLSKTIGEDRRRDIQYAADTLLFTQLGQPAQQGNLENFLDRRDQEDLALLISHHGRRMLRPPIRKTMRHSAFINDFDSWLEDTRSNIFPLSATDQEDYGSNSNPGRFALRVRSESDNPAQLVYINNDWRIGGDAEKAKVCYTLQMSDNVLTSLRSEFDYNSSDIIDFWANLHYQYSPSTRLHLLLGDHIDLAGGTVLYPMVSTPMALRTEEDSLGVMFYVEHLF